jgi:hypothetical protein
MARRIELFKPRGASEDEAQRVLARILPASWIITTNIKEHMFAGPRRPEIDSVLLAPLGLFVLDFKNFRGVITPMSNQPWGGLQEMKANPLEQAYDNMYSVKNLLERHDEKLKDIWIEPLIVLTNESVELDWRTSDVNAESRIRVALLGEVEARVRQIAATKRMALGADMAAKVLDAFKPISVPDGLFDRDDWRSANTIDKAVPSRPPRSPEAKPAADDHGQSASLSLANSVASHALTPPAKPVPVPSPLDVLIYGMFRGEKQGLFREYLHRFGEPKFLKRRPNDELSVAELEYLSRAKEDFETRQALSEEVVRTITPEDVDPLLRLSSVLRNVSGLVSLDRMTDIVKGYARALCREGDVATINSLVGACRMLTDARQSDEFRHLQARWDNFCYRTFAGNLMHRLAGGTRNDGGLRIARPAMPMWFQADDEAMVVAQELIRDQQSPSWCFIDKWLMPDWVPWSSAQRAKRLLRRIEKICKSDIMIKIQGQLQSIANLLDETISNAVELKSVLLRESLTGERGSRRGRSN